MTAETEVDFWPRRVLLVSLSGNMCSASDSYLFNDHLRGFTRGAGWVQLIALSTAANRVVDPVPAMATVGSICINHKPTLYRLGLRNSKQQPDDPVT